jgi:hypothetical protein
LKKGFKNIIAIGFFFFNEDKKEKAFVGDTHSPATLEPPTLGQINPDAVFGIVSSGTRNVNS